VPLCQGLLLLMSCMAQWNKVWPLYIPIHALSGHAGGPCTECGTVRFMRSNSHAGPSGVFECNCVELNNMRCTAPYEWGSSDKHTHVVACTPQLTRCVCPQDCDIDVANGCRE
jgi:hypothetical protein